MKQILQHNEQNWRGQYELIVPPSRYRKIFSDYLAMTANTVENLLDTCMKYKFFIITLPKEDAKLDDFNSYKIIKGDSKGEYQGNCENCTCGMKKRWINKEAGICYYRIAIENNYLTKINGETIKIDD